MEPFSLSLSCVRRGWEKMFLSQVHKHYNCHLEFKPAGRKNINRKWQLCHHVPGCQPALSLWSWVSGGSTVFWDPPHLLRYRCGTNMGLTLLLKGLWVWWWTGSQSGQGEDRAGTFPGVLATSPQVPSLSTLLSLFFQPVSHRELFLSNVWKNSDTLDHWVIPRDHLLRNPCSFCACPTRKGSSSSKKDRLWVKKKLVIQVFIELRCYKNKQTKNKAGKC